jgi:hypothetical protein
MKSLASSPVAILLEPLNLSPVKVVSLKDLTLLPSGILGAHNGNVDGPLQEDCRKLLSFVATDASSDHLNSVGNL